MHNVELQNATLGPSAIAPSIWRGRPDDGSSRDQGRCDHAALEPMNCAVHVRKDGCEVCSQALGRVQAAEPPDCHWTRWWTKIISSAVDLADGWKLMASFGTLQFRRSH